MKHLASSDALLLLSAFRFGWIPSFAEGGDGVRSITQLEWDQAGDFGMPRAALLANREGWPAQWVEALEKPESGVGLANFRKSLESTLRGQYFSSDPSSIGPIVYKTLTELRDQLRNPDLKVEKELRLLRFVTSKELTRDMFPTSLKTRKFIPNEKLVISYKLNSSSVGCVWVFAGIFAIASLTGLLRSDRPVSLRQFRRLVYCTSPTFLFDTDCHSCNSQAHSFL